MQSHKFLEIQNPKEEILRLPTIGNKSPSPGRGGSDINKYVMPNHKQKGHFHLRSRSNAVNTVLSQTPSKKSTQTPMRSRYREEYDLKSNKYNTV
jgi:hypothetical protein